MPRIRPARGATSPATPVGLAVGPSGYKIPIGIRAHAAFDNALEATDTSITFRFFMPLSDPSATAIWPAFGNQAVGTTGGAPDNDAPNDITIAAAVENGSTIVPFTFNGGAATAVVSRSGEAVVLPDGPKTFGSQVTTNDKYGVPLNRSGCWMRVYVQVAASRVDTAGITSGSPTVTDVSVAAGDAGRLVTGTGIPAKTYIGNVTPGVSFQLFNSPSANASTVNATATNASASLSVRSVIPLNLGPLANSDALTNGTGANLTLAGSGSVSGGSGSFMYGPTVVFGSDPTATEIIGVASDSIYDGYSDDFHSTYFGPVARACMTHSLPLVKLSRGGETAVSFGSASTRRIRHPYTAGVTRWILEYGTNDQVLSSAAGVVQAKDRLLTIAYYLKSQGGLVYIATVPPRTSSTDSWATTTNQTPLAGSAVTYLAALNQWIRSTPAPFSGYLDLEGACSSAQDSGKWAAGATIDGVHPTDTLMRGTITDQLNTLLATF